MTKLVNFSRVFPEYHLKKGEKTHFVEAILTQLGIDYTSHDYFIWLCENNKKISEPFLNDFFNSLSQDIYPKSHTIRNHVKPLNVGDYINPTCWAGKPYNKTPEGFWKIKFAPDIEVVKTFDYTVMCRKGVEEFFINGNSVSENNEYMRQWSNSSLIKEIAKNDGLSLINFLEWFKHPANFTGKIVSWNENIQY